MTINDIDLPNEVFLPFQVVPASKKSDALDDFYIRFSEWVSYISEVLLFSHLGSKIPIADFSAKPQIKASIQRKNKKVKFLPTPKINVKDNNIDSISRNLSRNLFHHSISQLVTNYEIFLNELTEHILWENSELLAIEEKQLTTKEIFELSDIEDIQGLLIERKVLDHVMKSYPKRIEAFQKLFHVGIHSKKSPMPIVEMHDLIEVRNIIQHNDGHCSKQYLQRMSLYKDLEHDCFLSGLYGTIKIDFIWLLGFGKKMLKLTEFIDKEVSKKWKTIRTGD